MLTPNPEIKRQLEQAGRQLAALKAEKKRLFPPNPYPFAQPDAYPRYATPAQIAKHNALDAEIASLEARIDELQLRLYAK